jgi:hypothetical protein
MLDTFGFPTPQGANYQEFYGSGAGVITSVRDWVKPRGASMVRFLLLGAGGGGYSAGGRGGGSGAVTSWIGPAIFIPDVLRINTGAGGIGGATGGAGGTTSVVYQRGTLAAGYTLLSATTGNGYIAGIAVANNYFGASGIYTSIAGDTGALAGTAITEEEYLEAARKRQYKDNDVK